MAANKSYTVVVKLGTSVLTAGSRCLDQTVMVELVRQCVQLQHSGHRVVLVTSGAVTAGRSHLNNPQLPNTVATKQLLAAVGQVCLIQIWQRLFAIYGLHIGQMLLTRADLEDRERFLNARDTLLSLLSQHIVPVINENDAVATAEIKIGDNDNLSALVAILANADKLLLLTDQQGLFTADPRCNPEAQLLQEIDTIDDDLRSIAGRSLSGLGVGGMSTKLQAAEIACRAGIEVVIAAGHQPTVLTDVMLDKPVGTRFRPAKTALEKRKWWIFGAPIAGEIVVDSGAADALRQRGASLLPKGICRIEGNFSRGDVVRLSNQAGQQLAYGVSCYESNALRIIAGHHSGQISALLGYAYGSVAVHRDDMIVTLSEVKC